jgi:ubiquinone/menaquinone biosynthesis C-methylase UbiE
VPDVAFTGVYEVTYFNAWANPAKAGADDVIEMAAFLEQRALTPDTQAVNQELCTVIDPKPGERLLEVGSGSGLLCRMLAPRLQSNGCIVGLDISPEFLAEAQKYAFQAGIVDRLVFETGRAEALPYKAASFDCAFAARLLLHALDPDTAVCEMARVVKPGGRVVVMDWDFGTICVDHSDRELTRRLLEWRNDHRGGNNWSGRQLWRRMVDAGLRNLSVHPWVSVALSESDGLTQSLWRAAQAACDGDAISSTECDVWVTELEARLQDGTFFASIVYFIVEGWVASLA